MIELIEELKNNQNINIAKGLENRVNIDYIIDRLEGINSKQINLLDEVAEYLSYLSGEKAKELYNKIYNEIIKKDL